MPVNTNACISDMSKSTSGFTTVEFPAGVPKPNQTRDWGQSIESNLATLGLTDVANERLPPGQFKKLWSDEALQDPPKLPSKASFNEQAKWRQMRDDVERKRSENTQIKEQCETWFKSKNHEYFVLITDTMKRTQPGLRDLLRDRYFKRCRREHHCSHFRRGLQRRCS